LKTKSPLSFRVSGPDFLISAFLLILQSQGTPANAFCAWWWWWRWWRWICIAFSLRVRRLVVN